jgi:DNA-binding CsgD family transcriptional regulator
MINNGEFTNIKSFLQIAGMHPGDNSIEFQGIRKTKQVLWMQNGNNHYFNDLPLEHFNLLKNKYLKDHKAVRYLTQVTDHLSRQVELFTYYLYGDVDSTPDISSDGVLSESENFRDKPNCPSLLWNSKNLNIGNHILTPRQRVIIDLIGNNLPDKAIASILGISHKTLDFHKYKLYKAVGVSNKLDLLRLSMKFKIVA